MLIDARRALDAVANNDPRALYRFSLPEERSPAGLGLTEEKFVQLWERLIWPRISRVALGPKTSYMQDGGHQAIAYYECRSPDGRRVLLAAIAWASGDGRGGLSCSAYLLTAWFTLHAFENPGYVETKASPWQIRLDALRRDSAVLREIGISGIYADGPGGGYSSFEDLEARWTKRLAEVEAEAAESNRPD
jgi:hypothetical protein